MRKRKLDRGKSIAQFSALIKRNMVSKTAKIKLQPPGLVCAFKMCETLTSCALELLGFPHVMFVWGNMMYPKTKLTQPNIPSDDSIDKYEHFEYGPITGTNLNNSGGDIRINIETQDLFTYPSESFLIIEGRLTKADGTAYANAVLVSLTNNAIMHLFKTIKYQLSGQEIESVMHPSHATTMLGLLKYPDDFSKSQGLNQLWYKDTTTGAEVENAGWNIRKKYIIDNSDPKGTFSFRVPLKHIFGFCEDYNKILYGMKQTLTLTRNDDNDAIFRAKAADAGIITLDKISWYMPHVMPADKEKMKLYKIIEKKEKLPV